MTSPTLAKQFLNLQKLLQALPRGFWAAFFKASAWGAFIAALPYLFLTLPMGLLLLAFSPVTALVIALLPLAVAWTGTLVLLLAIHLPAGPILCRNRFEHVQVHALIGMLGGASIALAMFFLLGTDLANALFNAVVGGIAGTVTGTMWGRSRSKFDSQPRNGVSSHTSNPIHDLIY